MSLCEAHYLRTGELVRAIDFGKIAAWLLNEGYYPEQNILPPLFRCTDFQLRDTPYKSGMEDLARRKLIGISYPKSPLSTRKFSVVHPHSYHDLVYHLSKNWNLIVDHLFDDNQRIYSYSFPIPVSSKNVGQIGDLRSGRMIYEWLEMAEGDLTIDASNYKYIIRTDISNFYPSVYTHGIAWALHGRERALKDKDYELVGSKLDRVVQYANDIRTNGIPIGPAVSDLLAEVILAGIDKEVSNGLGDIDFVATRFKDDYRFLCNNESDGDEFLRILTRELSEYNLTLNEKKTVRLSLPEGLYRAHDREYNLHSMRAMEEVLFKKFEMTLLNTIEIHRKYPGTSILEKFIRELYKIDGKLKIKYSEFQPTKIKQIKKTISLLLLMERESTKILCHVLAVFESIIDEYHALFDVKSYFADIINSELKRSIKNKSEFEFIWHLYFSRAMKLNIMKFENDLKDELFVNEFVKYALACRSKLFADSGVRLTIGIKDARKVKLNDWLDVFKRDRD